MHCALRPDERRARVARVAGGEHRIGLEQALVVAGIGHGDRAAGLDGIAREPRGRRQAHLERSRVGRPARGPDDELVALEQPEDGCVRGEELRRPPDDLVQNDGRIELGGEEAGRPRELLRQGTRAPLALEQAAALEGAAGGGGQVACQLEVVVREASLLGEEDEHEPALLTARRLDRGGEQRAVAALVRDPLPALVEAVVVAEPRRREHAPPARARAKRVVGAAEALFQEPDQRCGQAVQAREP